MSFVEDISWTRVRLPTSPPIITMHKVYAVGVLKADLSDNPRRFIIDRRLWYLFADFEAAQKCVLENQSDIFEYYYNIALIEEISVLNPFDQNNAWNIPTQWWYKITYHPSDDNEIPPTIEEIPPPKCAENVACFWVG